MRVVIGQGSCGIATGAKKTAAEFEKQIAEKNISNVTLGVTGCVGTCYLEPIVDVYDDDGKMTRYVKVQPDKVEKIIEEHLMQHQVAEDQAITEEDKEFVGKQQRVVLRNCGVINPENIEDYIALPQSMLGEGEHYVLGVRGESMIEAGIMDGDYVVVRKQPTAYNGDIVVAMVEDDATVKRFYRENGHFRLQPENPTMEPIIVPEVTILGKVVSLYRIF